MVSHDVQCYKKYSVCLSSQAGTQFVFKKNPLLSGPVTHIVFSKTYVLYPIIWVITHYMWYLKMSSFGLAILFKLDNLSVDLEKRYNRRPHG